jgi:hypothetical protein
VTTRNMVCQLKGQQVSAIALDYGGYAVTFAVSRLSLRPGVVGLSRRALLDVSVCTPAETTQRDRHIRTLVETQ